MNLHLDWKHMIAVCSLPFFFSPLSWWAYCLLVWICPVVCVKASNGVCWFGYFILFSCLLICISGLFGDQLWPTKQSRALHPSDWSFRSFWTQGMHFVFSSFSLSNFSSNFIMCKMISSTIIKILISRLRAWSCPKV